MRPRSSRAYPVMCDPPSLAFRCLLTVSVVSVVKRTSTPVLVLLLALRCFLPHGQHPRSQHQVALATACVIFLYVITTEKNHSVEALQHM